MSHVSVRCPGCNARVRQEYEFDELASKFLEKRIEVTCPNETCGRNLVLTITPGRVTTEFGPVVIVPRPEPDPPPPMVNASPEPVARTPMALASPPPPVPREERRPPPPSRSPDILDLPGPADNDWVDASLPGDPPADAGAGRPGWWARQSAKDKKNWKLLIGLLGGLFVLFVLAIVFSGPPTPDRPRPAARPTAKAAEPRP